MVSVLETLPTPGQRHRVPGWSPITGVPRTKCVAKVVRSGGPRRRERSGQAGPLVEDPDGGALKRVGISWCPLEGEVGGRLDLGLPSSAPPSVPPLRAGASEFAESTVTAWSIERGPRMC